LAARADRAQNRGVADVCIVVCDGLKGLPEAIGTVWPATVTQTCIVHLLRNSFRYASRRDWPALAKDLKPVYTAPTEAAALDRLADFASVWEQRYPAIVRLWQNAGRSSSRSWTTEPVAKWRVGLGDPARPSTIWWWRSGTGQWCGISRF
jgi:transposase-like protein